MLIRFAVKNFLSFKDETEFNLLPGRSTRLNHHKYQRNGVEILKLTGLYGANGSGKSNLIKAISILKSIMLNGIVPNSVFGQKYKLSGTSVNEPIEFGIEFVTNSTIYYYSISMNNGVVLDEYFSKNDTNQKELLIFHRTNQNKKNSITFFREFEDSSENLILKKIIESDLLKPEQPLFRLLYSITNDAFIDIKVAFNWFRNSLTIIYPTTKPNSLSHQIGVKKGFMDFANELICSFSTGISKLHVDSQSIEDFYGDEHQSEIEEIKADVKNNPDKVILKKLNIENEEVVIINENGNILAKRLFFEHMGEKNERVEFKLKEESDGTKRLLEYLPAWNDLINFDRTYVVDEIERSIHPMMIKQLIEKFSSDKSTKGQLIFSTHESNLLDQDILRTDEIWFVEKNIFGATKLYPLSDFKEHNTIDIRKGYLNGRYGAIPFLGNLKDLNWNKYHDETE